MYNHRDLYRVICVETVEGKGVDGDPSRIVKTFYDEKGEYIGRIDPIRDKKYIQAVN